MVCIVRADLSCGPEVPRSIPAIEASGPSCPLIFGISSWPATLKIASDL